MAGLAESRHSYRQLLAKLMETVRPEFRADVFRPPRDSTVFFSGVCIVPACTVMVSFTARHLCVGHYDRWSIDQRGADYVDFDHWLAVESDSLLVRNTPAACAIEGCNRSVSGRGMCARHREQWVREGRPDDESGWISRTPYKRSRLYGGVEHTCELLSGCPRWTDSPNQKLCRTHYSNWHEHGRLELADWHIELVRAGDPELKLGSLDRQLRLEFQFGIQCRNDEAAKATRMAALRQTVRTLELANELGLTSLLDWNDEDWNDFVGGRREYRPRGRLLSVKARRMGVRAPTPNGRGPH